jgi:Na+/H+-translocating membrane pyrophosphatase
LGQEHLYLGIFSAVSSIILGLAVDQPTNFPYTATAFLIVCSTSIAAGYIGMSIAIYTNTRTTFWWCGDTNDRFLTAFRGGRVLRFVLVGLDLLCLDLIVILYKATWFNSALDDLVANPHGVGCFGAGVATLGVLDVHQQLLVLKEENVRLKDATGKVSQVEMLEQENKVMKIELQETRAQGMSECFKQIGI